MECLAVHLLSVLLMNYVMRLATIQSCLLLRMRIGKIMWQKNPSIHLLNKFSQQ